MTTATMLYGSLTLLAFFLLLVLTSNSCYVLIDYRCWLVGLAWDGQKRTLNIMPLPMVTIKFEFKKRRSK